MKIVFVGPSLPDADLHLGEGLSLHPPARQGDIMNALSRGATAIGLIDGFFEGVAPVWHKELLYALSKGVAVYGASSMGALRAAECAAFGMIGVGRIFEDYRDGRRDDDADVALLHGPAELGYPALTVPIVNIDGTLDEISRHNSMPREDVSRLQQAARQIFYKERSWKRVVVEAGLDWAHVGPILHVHQWDQKRLDALALLACLKSDDAPVCAPMDWSFNTTPVWRRLYSASG
ncbi:antibiotic resistance protein (plasmid) [Peteryoungia desertarenae]|uniref:Antibiotic resistance protein n=1 Tax=Peteryoungia desertarenae TaxID=1813451 RepID=A0ABX6QUG2_9HYPH|nr:TfuA-like protein [Peteryoungia desertarenae]QLF71956.1 antibiotic resistance protein [Peteryoungia desertarenae]